MWHAEAQRTQSFKLVSKRNIYLLLIVFAIAAVAYFSFTFFKSKPVKNNSAATADSSAYFISGSKRIEIPRPGGFVNDYGNVFLERERWFLDSLIQAHEAKTTNQFAIVTFDTVEIAKTEFDAYTLQLARKWGVGQKGKNNGVLIAFCRRMYKVRIQTGYGIEKLIADSTVQSLVDNKMIPEYKNAKYFEGTLNGMREMMRLLEVSINH